MTTTSHYYSHTVTKPYGHPQLQLNCVPSRLIKYNRKCDDHVCVNKSPCALKT